MGDRVRGKVALVTGAASGIGRATSDLLRDEGASVYYADINDKGIRAAAHLKGHALALDVTNEDDWLPVSILCGSSKGASTSLSIMRVYHRTIMRNRSSSMSFARPTVSY